MLFKFIVFIFTCGFVKIKIVVSFDTKLIRKLYNYSICIKVLDILCISFGTLSR